MRTVDTTLAMSAGKGIDIDKAHKLTGQKTFIEKLDGGQ